MIDLTVIIVTWNSENEINACVESVINNSKVLNAELIIVDNNSSDNTFEIVNKINFSNLQTYKNESNLGFTKAVNQGISTSRGKNILLLNPDTVLKESALEVLNKFLADNSEYAAAAPLVLNEDGSIQYSVRDFPTYWTMFCEFSLLAYLFSQTKLFGGWKMKFFKYSNDADIRQPMGAVFMIRKSVLTELDNMDEQFEMFFNDVDLCKRVINKGYKIRLLTSPKVIHEHGSSINKDRIRMIRIWNKDCYQYFKKHHNNSLLLLWLKINLKISEIIRILYHKIRY